MELPFRVTIGIVTVKMGLTAWNGYCEVWNGLNRNKRVVQHVRDPKTGDEYFEVKLNESAGLNIGTDYCESCAIVLASLL